MNKAQQGEPMPIESHQLAAIETPQAVSTVEMGGPPNPNAVDVNRAAMEVQAQVLMARKFPRDEEKARALIMAACARPTMAEKSMYAFPRGKEVVRGPSIRLAEEMARAWGNIQPGWRTTYQCADYSEIEVFAWDLQTNHRKVIGPFRVKHWRDTKGGGYRIKDERDIYELCANMAQRRLRACILAILPADLVEEAVFQIGETLAGDIKDRPAVIKKLVAAFKDYKVTQEMIEARYDHHVIDLTGQEIGELRAIFATIKDGEKKAADYFGTGEEAPETAAMGERLGEGLMSDLPAPKPIKMPK